MGIVAQPLKNNPHMACLDVVRIRECILEIGVIGRLKLGIKYKVLGTDLVNRRTCLVGSAAMPPSAPAVAHKWLTDPTLQDGAMEAVVPPTVVLRSGEYPVLPQAASRGRGRQGAKKETDQFHSYLV